MQYYAIIVSNKYSLLVSDTLCYAQVQCANAFSSLFFIFKGFIRSFHIYVSKNAIKLEERSL